jgi:YHYH protein
MKTIRTLSKNHVFNFIIAFAGIFFTLTTSVLADDPRTNSWFTTYAGQYARIYTNDISRTNGITQTTWTNAVGGTIQSLPAYCGVQEIYSSSNWVYIRSTGLGSFVMGPWYLNAAHTQPFPNWPVNQKTLYRIPRNPSVPTTKTVTGGGPIGYFVDGAAMFNSWDAYTWSTVSNTDAQNITGYWNRDAYVNEGVSFDPNNAHQAGGQYHYHANPPALRYQLGDHVDFNSVTKIYSEDMSAPTKHSPILAWTEDGLPVYGPYGYSNATNANSGIRRMISGYVLRNGQNGTENLTNVGRINLPQWAARLFKLTGSSTNQNGAPFTGIHTLGCYMEDNDYLGDLINTNTGTNYQQGVDFDLDEYNERWCVTPEFPNGTNAYFVSISSNGAPTFPYNIGRGFYGSPVGGTVTAISETVATNFLGNTNLVSTLNPPSAQNGKITLSWSAIEGGSYQVEATTNLANSSGWTVLQTGVSPNEIVGVYTNTISASQQFYRVGRTAVANYDSAGTTLFAVSSIAPGGSASRGQTAILTITLPSSPPNPPAGAPITSVTIGSITATSATCTVQGTVTAVFMIPANYTPTGAQNVIVTFTSGPPPYTVGSFTIN